MRDLATLRNVKKQPIELTLKYRQGMVAVEAEE